MVENGENYYMGKKSYLDKSFIDLDDKNASKYWDKNGENLAIVDPGQAKKCFTVREKDLSKHYQHFFLRTELSQIFIACLSIALTILQTSRLRKPSDRIV